VDLELGDLRFWESHTRELFTEPLLHEAVEVRTWSIRDP